MSKQLGYIAIDQYGQHYELSKHPRRELLDIFGASKAEKMYVDTLNGENKHIGYVIQGLWLRVFTVNEWKKVSA